MCAAKLYFCVFNKHTLFADMKHLSIIVFFTTLFWAAACSSPKDNFTIANVPLRDLDNDLHIGCECLDRDYADWDSYKEYLIPLGMKYIRIQAGWAKTEKRPGVYDFAWLDHIIDDAVSMGLEPWLQTSYGNPIYEGGGTPYLAGGWPMSGEALTAWDNWVEEMAVRYHGKVHTWEIWNEPELFLEPEPYIEATEFGERREGVFESLIDLHVRTAGIIKRHDPDASIAALAMARLNPAFLDEVLCALKADGSDSLFDWVTYHGYRYRPEDMYPQVDSLQAVLSAHSDRIRLWQGETGAPSKGHTGGALTNYEWSETSQAKWDLRRIISDHGRGIRTGVFCISEMNNGANDYVKKKNTKGILQTDDSNRVLRPKEAWYALCNLTTLYQFLDETLPSGEIVTPEGMHCSKFLFRDKETGVTSAVIWDDSAIPSDTQAEHGSDVTLPFKLRHPVSVDIRTGLVHRLKADGNIMHGVPLYDSPVMITERKILPR